MSSRYSFCKCLLAVLLALAGLQTVGAQEAFYIYRNDGDFDGFFFDQVKRIGYSKTDLQGNDHDIYVVQEVETADSLYRIPLAAIDSVGFQQPEIILNPRLRKMADLDANGRCMSDYVRKVEIVSNCCNYYKLEFDPNTPEGLLPKEGDVLVDFYNPMYKREEVKEEDYSGFSGKVQWSGKEKGSEGYMVYTEPLESLSDVFVQFITTEEVTEDENGQQARRLAGWPRRALDDGIVELEGAGSGTILDIDLPLKHDVSVGKGTVTTELDVKLRSRLAVTYKITMKDFFIKTLSIHEAALKAALAGKFDGDYEAQIVGMPQKTGSIKFPANLPVLQTKPIPNAFLRLKGEMGARIDLPAVGYRTKQSVLIDKDRSPMMSFSFETNGPLGKLEKGILEGTDLSLYMNGSAQIGVKLSANIETNDWLEDIFSTGIFFDLYLGPQVEGKVELKESVKDLIDGSTNLYHLMKGSNIDVAGLAANMEVKGQVKLLNDTESKTFLEYNKKFWEATWYLFPDLAESKASFDKETGDIVATVRATKPVFVPTKLGMGVFDYEGQCVDKGYNSINYFINEHLANEGSFRFKNLNCGPYSVRPMLQVLGLEVPADPTFDIVVKPVLVQGNDSTKESFRLKADEEKIEIPFKTNAKEVGVYLLDSNGKRTTPAEGFYEISDPGTGIHERILTLHTDKNDHVLPQEWNVLLSARVKAKGETYEAIDTVGIIQSGGEVTFTGMVVSCNGVGKRTTHRYYSSSWGENYDDHTREEPKSGYGLIIRQSLETTRVGDIIYCSAHIVYTDTDTKDEGVDDIPGTSFYSYLRTHKAYRFGDLSFTIDLTSPGQISVGDGRFELVDDEYHLTDTKDKRWGNDIVTHDVSIYSTQTVHEREEFTWQGPVPFVEDKDRQLIFRLTGRDIFSVTQEKQTVTNTNSYDLFEEETKTGTMEDHYDIFFQFGAPDDDSNIYIQINY